MAHTGLANLGSKDERRFDFMTSPLFGPIQRSLDYRPRTIDAGTRRLVLYDRNAPVIHHISVRTVKQLDYPDAEQFFPFFSAKQYFHLIDHV